MIELLSIFVTIIIISAAMSMGNKQMKKINLQQRIGLIIIRLPIYLMRLVAFIFKLDVELNVGVVTQIHIDDITDDILKTLNDSQIAEIKLKRLLRKARANSAEA